ncbi:MAG: S46 family peptidase, partial [Shewanella sp.]
TQAKRYQLQIDTIEALGQKDADIAIKYAGNLASMANRMKKLNGLLAGFKATDIVGIKQRREQDFLAWLKQNPTLNQQLIAELEVLLTEQQQQTQRNYYFTNAQSSTLLTAATTLYRLAKERQKPDAEREMGYQERDIALLSSRLKRIDSSFAVSVDKTLWLQDLQAYLNQSNRVAALDDALGLHTKDNALAATLEGWYTLTSLTDPAKRLAWLDADANAFERSSDPFIRLAVALYDSNMTQEKAEKTLEGKLASARPAYMAAVIEYYKANHWPVYPDANGTLRISYGVVDGYQSRDALYKQPFTRLDGIVAKHTGAEPYNAPQKLLNAIAQQRFGDYKVATVYQDPRSWLCRLFACADKPEAFNSVPVNFLSSVDTTGGNSGSPMFNGNGELVGLNFDSTYEAITKDWFFNPTITRAIHVDIRYILWMMAEVDRADNLLQELTLVRSQ